MEGRAGGLRRTRIIAYGYHISRITMLNSCSTPPNRASYAPRLQQLMLRALALLRLLRFAFGLRHVPLGQR